MKNTSKQTYCILMHRNQRSYLGGGIDHEYHLVDHPGHAANVYDFTDQQMATGSCLTDKSLKKTRVLIDEDLEDCHVEDDEGQYSEYNPDDYVVKVVGCTTTFEVIK